MLYQTKHTSLLTVNDCCACLEKYGMFPIKLPLRCGIGRSIHEDDSGQLNMMAMR